MIEIVVEIVESLFAMSQFVAHRCGGDLGWVWRAASPHLVMTSNPWQPGAAGGFLLWGIRDRQRAFSS